MLEKINKHDIKIVSNIDSILTNDSTVIRFEKQIFKNCLPVII